MRAIFLVKDNYPESGACTSLLNNIFFIGKAVEQLESIDVLAVKDIYTSKKNYSYKGVDVHDLTLMSKVSNNQYKHIFLKHPLAVLHGAFDKLISKAADKSINNRIVRSIEDKLDDTEAKTCDIMVAVMGSFDVAAAAMNYKKNNPKIKFVLYQVDPCSTNEAYSSLTQKERKDFEEELYKNSDAIITTPILFAEAKKIYSDEILSKMISMEFPNVVPKEWNNAEDPSGIRCVFTGNIYGGIRDPRYTWRLFDKVDSCIGFEMIGSMHPKLCEESKQHRVIYKGSKSLNETKKELMNADVLVNIGNKMLNQVPSKIFEYISYGKPVINICKNRDCPSIAYFEKYPYVLNLFEEDEIFDKQVTALNMFINESSRKRVSSKEILRLYKTCTPQFCAEQMINLFKQLTEEQKYQ